MCIVFTGGGRPMIIGLNLTLVRIFYLLQTQIRSPLSDPISPTFHNVPQALHRVS
jgi:hypothetical protein